MISPCRARVNWVYLKRTPLYFLATVAKCRGGYKGDFTSLVKITKMKKLLKKND
jgi:hypothetical protein